MTGEQKIQEDIHHAHALYVCAMKSENARPLILVTNDDGVYSKGILALTEAVLPFGDIVVVAPDKPQSGMGHAVTINNLLRLHPLSYDLPVQAAFACSGTPVDCVKLAIYKVLYEAKDRKVLAFSWMSPFLKWREAQHATSLWVYSVMNGQSAKDVN
jgi:hypothetical protein